MSLLSVHLLSPAALAQEGETAPSPSVSESAADQNENASKREAREHFVRGAALVARAEWSGALDAFERSAKLHPHPVTFFNIGVCLRASAQYSAARQVLLLALEQNSAAGGQLLSQTLSTQARAFIEEIDRLLVTVSVRLVPADATIAVDGRPLKAQRTAGNGKGKWLAGLLPPGKGDRAPGEHFEIVMDPGAHVFVVSHTGFEDIVVNRSFSPGTRQALDLELSQLPATIHINADAQGVVVAVNDLDIGIAPVVIHRPPGAYRIVMRKPEYVAYETQISVRPGESTNITGRLSPVEPSVLGQWWFWGAAGVIVAGVTATTYALTRPQPERPPPNGGSLGWVIDAR